MCIANIRRIALAHEKAIQDRKVKAHKEYLRQLALQEASGSVGARPGSGGSSATPQPKANHNSNVSNVSNLSGQMDAPPKSDKPCDEDRPSDDSHLSPPSSITVPTTH